MQTRNYVYGCLPPADRSAFMHQVEMARRWRNQLCAIERDRRAAIERVRLEMFPRYAEVEQAVKDREEDLKAHLEGVKRRNAAARRKVATAEDRALTKSLREARKEAVERRKQLRAELRESAPQLKQAWAEIDAAMHARMLAERKQLVDATGLYWGTYNEVHKSFEQTVHDTIGLPDWERRRPLRSLARRHGVLGAVDVERRGACCVQIIKGAKVADILAGRSSQLQIRLLPERRRRGQFANVRIRVASNPDRSPVWCDVRVFLHRAIPEGAVVNGAKLMMRRIGHRERWHLMLVLAQERWERETAAEGMVGVDLGWRMLADGSMRVAYWVGDDGREGELRLPAAELERWPYADELRSHVDAAFNAIQQRLLAWLAEPREVPAWLPEQTTALAQWRSAQRLAAVVAFWATARFPGDEGIFVLLDEWRRRRFNHIKQWELHQRERTVNWRTDVYRKFAAELAQQYRTVVVEDVDWRALARKVAADSNVTEYAKYNMRIAAPGALRAALAERFAAALAVEAADTTRTCHACGTINDFDQENELVHQCDACGVSWDQDANAARNLLVAGKLAPPPAQAPARPSGGRWQRRKAKKTEGEEGAAPPGAADVELPRDDETGGADALAS